MRSLVTPGGCSTKMKLDSIVVQIRTQSWHLKATLMWSTRDSQETQERMSVSASVSMLLERWLTPLSSMMECTIVPRNIWRICPRMAALVSGSSPTASPDTWHEKPFWKFYKVSRFARSKGLLVPTLHFSDPMDRFQYAHIRVLVLRQRQLLNSIIFLFCANP